MNRTTLPIREIQVKSRLRTEMGNLQRLANSIRDRGLVEPIVVNQDKVLIAGERRLRAHQLLKLEHIDVVYRETLSQDELHELELEENVNRKDMEWQEEALAILQIYRLKRRRGALEGWTYGQEQAAEMFQMSVGNVNYALRVAKRLEEELSLPADQRRIWGFKSAAEAYRLGLMAEEEEALAADLAKQSQRTINNSVQREQIKRIIEEVKEVESKPDLLADKRAKYESNPHNTVPFETYWAEKQKVAEEIQNTIYISNNLIHGDCIKYMLDPENKGRFDHIITDPPYGIDMDNLNQQNQHGGLVDLDKLVDRHQVDENYNLLGRFFPAAFQCTKDSAFVIVCGDAMVWQFMYECATKAGFAVQRWPFIWQKVNQSVMNNCAGFNTTKDYEIAMICRKPGATLQKKWNTSFCAASNVEATKMTGHPFAKPWDLTRAFLEMVSIERQTILEPFAGGGSMVLEMLRNQRNVIAVEMEEHWYNRLVENVKVHHYLKQNPKFIFK